MTTRRNFLQALGFAAIAGTILNSGSPVFAQTAEVSPLFPIPGEILSDPVLSFTSQQFVPFINTEFEIRGAGLRRAEVLQLLNVKEFVSKHNAERSVQGESFSLMFTSPRGAKVKTGEYEFTHFSLGDFKLTVTPVSAQANRFEAVINHQRL